MQTKSGSCMLERYHNHRVPFADTIELDREISCNACGTHLELIVNAPERVFAGLVKKRGES